MSCEEEKRERRYYEKILSSFVIILLTTTNFLDLSASEQSADLNVYTPESLDAEIAEMDISSKLKEERKALLIM